MDAQQIGIRLTGMKPADVRAGELGDLLSTFEDMIASFVEDGHPLVKKEALGIGLVTIEDKSVGLGFATKLEELTSPAYATITDAIAKEQYLQLPRKTLDCVRKLQTFINNHGCEGEMFSRNGEVKVMAVLSPGTTIPEYPEYMVETVMFGRITRVGGAEPRVALEIAKGRTLFCLVRSEDLARKLGERLYTLAGLSGIAKLRTDTLEVVEFSVNAITEYEGKRTLVEAISNLGRLTSKYYAGIEDVGKYIEELRG